MHSIHFQNVHLPKGPNLFALSVSEVVWASVALFFFLVSWVVGGEDFKESIGGSISLAVLLAALLAGAILCVITKPKNK